MYTYFCLLCIHTFSMCTQKWARYFVVYKYLHMSNNNRADFWEWSSNSWHSVLSSMFQCVSVLQCVAACCSVLHRVAVSNGRPIRGTVRWDPTGPWQYKILKIQRYGDNYILNVVASWLLRIINPFLTQGAEIETRLALGNARHLYKILKSQLYVCLRVAVWCSASRATHCITLATPRENDLPFWQCQTCCIGIAVCCPQFSEVSYVHQSGLQCAAVCCSVLQCLAEHCSGCGVLQCLGEYCSGGSVFQNVSLGLTQFGLLQCVAVCSLDNARHLNNAQKSSLLACRSVLQCVAVAASCSELQWVATLQWVAVSCSVFPWKGLTSAS